MKALRPVCTHSGVMLLGIAIFFVQGPSFVQHLGDRLADGGDSLLNTWILAWDAHALTTPGASVWDAPFYYPAKNTFTFSETMFGNLWLTLPVQLLTTNPILAFNALVLGSFVLGLYCTFLLVRGLTGSISAGIVAGVIFSFSPYRWSEIPHVQLLPFFWAPLALLLTHRFLEGRRKHTLIGLLAVLVAQYYTSIYLGTILIIMTGAFAGVYLIAECRGKERFAFITDYRLGMTLVVGGLLTGLALLPLVLPYLETARNWDFVRTQADNASFSCEFLSYFVPNRAFRSYTWLCDRVEGRIRGYCGLGIVPWTLALGGILIARRQNNPRLVYRFAWTGLVMAVLMLGPCLILLNQQRRFPLPYFLVYHLVPGGKAMRVPTRFIFPLLLCLAVLGGFAVAQGVKAWRHCRLPARLLIALAFIGLLCVDYAVTDDPGVQCEPRADFPPVYDYLAAAGQDRPVLELPAALGGQFHYLYYQTAHWRPLLDGESGSFTPAALEVARRTQGPPTSDTLHFLELTPAMTVVIHLDAYSELERAAWRSADLGLYGFRRAGQFGDAIVWERELPVPASATKLCVFRQDLQFSRALLRDRLDVTLVVAPAEPAKAWRFLERGLSEVTIEVVRLDGAPQRFRKTFSIPPYLLPGETATIKLDKVRGSFTDAVKVRIRGPLLEDFEIGGTHLARQ
jgi:hypothetical protein